VDIFAFTFAANLVVSVKISTFEADRNLDAGAKVYLNTSQRYNKILKVP